MMFKHIIFDIGNTLLYDLPNERDALRIRFEHFIHRSLSSDQLDCLLKSFHNMEYMLLFKELEFNIRFSDIQFNRALDLSLLLSYYDNDIYKANQMIEHFSKVQWPSKEMFVPPQIYLILNELKSRGQKMSIVSNYTSDVIEMLDLFRLTNYFETIIISANVGVEKPDTRIMEIALQRLNLCPSDCLYVGDHPYDVLCAKKAGLSMAWLAPRNLTLPNTIKYKEDFRLENITEILNIVFN